MSENISEILDDLKNRWGTLNDCDVLGSFDFTTFLVSLSSLGEKDFLALKDKALVDVFGDPDLYSIWKKVEGLRIHEYTHYLDTTSSLWGLYFIRDMMDAYEVCPKFYDTEESFFWKAQSFAKQVKSLRYNDYYTEHVDDAEYCRPWKCIPSIGRIFDEKGHLSDRGMLFFSYRNNNDERFVRMPVSMISLLEASATIQELQTLMMGSTYLDPLSFEVEKKIIERKTVDFLYDYWLAEYTICFHFLATMQNIPDLSKTLYLAKKILNICLNFRNEDFLKVDVHKIVSEIDSDYYEESNKQGFWDEISTGINKYGDRGMLFFLLAFSLPKRDYLSDSDVIYGIDFFLEKINLSYHMVMMNSRREIEDIVECLKKGKIHEMKSILNSSVHNFDCMHNGKQFYHSCLDSFRLPPALYGDDHRSNGWVGAGDLSFELNEKGFTESMVKILNLHSQWVYNFSKACGY